MRRRTHPAHLARCPARLQERDVPRARGGVSEKRKIPSPLEDKTQSRRLLVSLAGVMRHGIVTSRRLSGSRVPPQYVVGALLKRISEQGLDYLQRTIQRLEGMMDTLRPESILIDEIQDLSVSEVLALMLLTRLSAPQANRAIFVGDQFQSLNGNRFRWETWLNDLGTLHVRFWKTTHQKFSTITCSTHLLRLAKKTVKSSPRTCVLIQKSCEFGSGSVDWTRTRSTNRTKLPLNCRRRTRTKTTAPSFITFLKMNS